MEKKDHLFGVQQGGSNYPNLHWISQKRWDFVLMPEKASKKTHTCFFFRNPNANLEVQVHKCLVSVIDSKMMELDGKIKRCPESNPSNYLPNDFEGIPKLFMSIQWSFEVPKKIQGDEKNTLKSEVATSVSKSQFLKGNQHPAPHDFTVPGIQRSCFHHTFVKWEKFFMKAAGRSHVKLVGKTHQLGGFGATSDLETIFALAVDDGFAFRTPAKQTNRLKISLSHLGTPKNHFFDGWTWWFPTISHVKVGFIIQFRVPGLYKSETVLA